MQRRERPDTTSDLTSFYNKTIIFYREKSVAEIYQGGEGNRGREAGRGSGKEERGGEARKGKRGE